MGPVGTPVRRSSVQRLLALWLIGSVIGAALIALPDDDERILSFSRSHGPALLDLVGMLILIACWLPVPVLLWRRRSLVPTRTWWSAAAVAAVGTLALVLTVGQDLGWGWLPSAAVLVLAQALPLASLIRARAGQSS